MSPKAYFCVILVLSGLVLAKSNDDLENRVLALEVKFDFISQDLATLTQAVQNLTGALQDLKFTTIMDINSVNQRVDVLKHTLEDDVKSLVDKDNVLEQKDQDLEQKDQDLERDIEQASQALKDDFDTKINEVQNDISALEGADLAIQDQILKLINIVPVGTIIPWLPRLSKDSPLKVHIHVPLFPHVCLYYCVFSLQRNFQKAGPTATGQRSKRGFLLDNLLLT